MNPDPSPLTLNAVLRRRVRGWPCLAVWLVAHHPRWGRVVVVVAGAVLALTWVAGLGLCHTGFWAGWPALWPASLAGRPDGGELTGMLMEWALYGGVHLWLALRVWPRWQSRFHRRLAQAKQAQCAAAGHGSAAFAADFASD